MDIKHYTGFKSISHDIQFQPATPKKGKDLVDAGHVRNVSEYNNCIQASVIRQTSISKPPYITKLWLNEERKVIKVSCTCIYNKSKRCKHVYAVIHFVNCDESVTKTIRVKQWGIPSTRQLALEKYSKGRSCKLMFPKKHQEPPESWKQFTVQHSELQHSALKTILVSAEADKTELAVKATISCLLDEVEENMIIYGSKDYLTETLKFFSLQIDQHDIYLTNYELDVNVEQFYEENIVKSEEETMKLCCETIKQSMCKLWFDVRRQHLTASKDVHNIKVRRTKTIESLVQTKLNPTSINTESTRYGVTNEQIAKHFLSAINPLEKADMQARLFSNMGLVKMSLENYDTAIELFTTSINICRTNNIYEQLSRGYMSLATLYIKKGDTIKSMHQYNLAIEAAKKLKDNIDLMCTVLHTKAEDLIKLGDFHAAKKTLKKAYKLNSPNLEDRKIIEKYFRAVTTMCSAEDKLVVETNNRDLKKLYETMGDCACVVKNYPKAIEYYKLMLNYAELSGVSGKELATCYNSLAQTYEDNQMFKEAVQYFEKEFELMDNIKDALDAMSKIADNKESAEESMGDVVEVYDKAIKYCQEKNNLKEERRMIARCIKYLQRIGKTSEACSYQQKLNALKVPDKEDDSSSSECESHNSSIMDDKENCDNLDDITANSPLRQSPGPSLFNEYQEIMKNLARKPSTSKQSDVTSNVRKMPALLREKNVSFDDWLEDDLQPSKATKKQKTSLTESGVTSSTRKRSLDSPRSNTRK
uniref:Tonsoku-like protein n=1 Tax=Diabrotica virgifera virgifera TaxID=50390 RepID=A0A6P7GZQ9_DIAVI